MVKRTYFGIGVVTVLGIVVAAGIAQVISMKNNESSLDMKGKPANGMTYQGAEAPIDPISQEKEAPLAMSVKLDSATIYSTVDVPLEVIFRNNADAPVKLINLFDTPGRKKIMFNITLRNSNETPIFMHGGGKIDLSQDSMKYIELKKEETTSVRLNLIDFVPSNYSLKAGVYSVIVTYRNQYGENCFRGTLESEPIDLVLVR